MRKSVWLIGAAAFATAAHASDKPVLAAAPAWVTPAPPIDPAKVPADAPVLLVLDSQQRLGDGQVWNYVDQATRAVSPQVLSAIGTLQLSWQPDHGDLVVHKVEIIRGAERIDLLKDQATPFTVLRRERQLDDKMLDGVLTATMPVQGLAVGDILHVSYSTTNKDPTLKGNVQAIAPVLFEPARVQFARTRLVWPANDDIRWKGYAEGITAQPKAIGGGLKELVIPLPLPKQSEIPQDAPIRFQHVPLVEATSFDGWSGVAAVMAPLYDTKGLIAPGTPLAQEVADIAAADKDPLHRAAAALQLVQDKVRYLLLGMDTGNYVPQPPGKTWAVRYGDCKAKTLLLLAILHELGIEAEPVLANAKLGDLVTNRLPSAMAFNHVLVHATIGGESLWLDGTGAGARLADIRDTPSFGWVLPVRPTGAALVHIDTHADARPGFAATIDVDERAGVNLPAPFRMSVLMRGPVAEMLRVSAAQGSKDDQEKIAGNIVKRYMDDATLDTHAMTFDEKAGTATLVATGLTYPDWSKDDARQKSTIDATVTNLKFAPDRGRAAWKDMPVLAGEPDLSEIRWRIRLPAGGKDFALGNEAPVAETLGSLRYERTVTRSGDTVEIVNRIANSGAEMPATTIPDVRRRVALAAAKPVYAWAPASYPPIWTDVPDAKKAGRLEPVMAVFTHRIADEPKEASRYSDRAWMLARLYDRKGAIADYDRAIALDPDAATYLKRSELREAVGDKAGALADAKAAHEADPSSGDALGRLATLEAERGQRDAALAMLQERIDAGGDGKADFMAAKAEIEARGGDKAAALATMDAAIAENPGKPELLNSRCWIKGTSDTALDTALKDCTKAIELSDSPVAALDSRAMVYFRMKRFDDALTDLNAALTRSPDLPASMFMRGVIRKRLGDAKAAETDLSAARTLAPTIDETYQKYGIVP